MLKGNLPKEIRKKIQNQEITDQTSGRCPGYAQGNLVILPKAYAFDFLLFSMRNPKPCPILEVVESGKNLKQTAPGEPVTKVFPKYRVYEDGKLSGEYTDIDHLWQDDFVTFILGCSFTFESALMEAEIAMRHIEQNKNVAMYQTTIPCEEAGFFKGNLVVSMRPIKSEDVMAAVEITSKYPKVHGAPIHIGNPLTIGIHDIRKPDFGDAIEIEVGEIPMFWACGVTPQSVAMNVKPSIMITHAPGHMLITDIRNSSLEGVK